jgi:hypothetical protein
LSFDRQQLPVQLMARFKCVTFLIAAMTACRHFLSGAKPALDWQLMRFFHCQKRPVKKSNP